MQELREARESGDDEVLCAVLAEMCSLLCVASDDFARSLSSTDDFFKELLDILLCKTYSLTHLDTVHGYAIRVVSLFVEHVPRSAEHVVECGLLDYLLMTASNVYRLCTTPQLAEDVVRCFDAMSLDLSSVLLSRGALLTMIGLVHIPGPRIGSLALEGVNHLLAAASPDAWPDVKQAIPVIFAVLDDRLDALQSLAGGAAAAAVTGNRNGHDIIQLCASICFIFDRIAFRSEYAHDVFQHFGLACAHAAVRVLQAADELEISHANETRRAAIAVLVAMHLASPLRSRALLFSTPAGHHNAQTHDGHRAGDSIVSRLVAVMLRLFSAAAGASDDDDDDEDGAGGATIADDVFGNVAASAAPRPLNPSPRHHRGAAFQPHSFAAQSDTTTVHTLQGNRWTTPSDITVGANGTAQTTRIRTDPFASLMDNELGVSFILEFFVFLLPPCHMAADEMMSKSSNSNNGGLAGEDGGAPAQPQVCQGYDARCVLLPTYDWFLIDDARQHAALDEHLRTTTELEYQRQKWLQSSKAYLLPFGLRATAVSFERMRHQTRDGLARPILRNAVSRGFVFRRMGALTATECHCEEKRTGEVMGPLFTRSSMAIRLLGSDASSAAGGAQSDNDADSADDDAAHSEGAGSQTSPAGQGAGGGGCGGIFRRLFSCCVKKDTTTTSPPPLRDQDDPSSTTSPSFATGLRSGTEDDDHHAARRMAFHQDDSWQPQRQRKDIRACHDVREVLLSMYAKAVWEDAASPSGEAAVAACMAVVLPGLLQLLSCTVSPRLVCLICLAISRILSAVQRRHLVATKSADKRRWESLVSPISPRLIDALVPVMAVAHDDDQRSSSGGAGASLGGTHRGGGGNVPRLSRLETTDADVPFVLRSVDLPRETGRQLCGVAVTFLACVSSLRVVVAILGPKYAASVLPKSILFALRTVVRHPLFLEHDAFEAQRQTRIRRGQDGGSSENASEESDGVSGGRRRSTRSHSMSTANVVLPPAAVVPLFGVPDDRGAAVSGVSASCSAADMSEWTRDESESRADEVNASEDQDDESLLMATAVLVQPVAFQCPVHPTPTELALTVRYECSLLARSLNVVRDGPTSEDIPADNSLVSVAEAFSGMSPQEFFNASAQVVGNFQHAVTQETVISSCLEKIAQHISRPETRRFLRTNPDASADLRANLMRLVTWKMGVPDITGYGPSLDGSAQPENVPHSFIERLSRAMNVRFVAASEEDCRGFEASYPGLLDLPETRRVQLLLSEFTNIFYPFSSVSQVVKNVSRRLVEVVSVSRSNSVSIVSAGGSSTPSVDHATLLPGSAAVSSPSRSNAGATADDSESPSRPTSVNLPAANAAAPESDTASQPSTTADSRVAQGSRGGGDAPPVAIDVVLLAGATCVPLFAPSMALIDALFYSNPHLDALAPLTTSMARRIVALINNQPCLRFAVLRRQPPRGSRWPGACCDPRLTPFIGYHCSPIHQLRSVMGCPEHQGLRRALDILTELRPLSRGKSDSIVDAAPPPQNPGAVVATGHDGLSPSRLFTLRLWNAAVAQLHLLCPRFALAVLGEASSTRSLVSYAAIAAVWSHPRLFSFDRRRAVFQCVAVDARLFLVNQAIHQSRRQNSFMIAKQRIHVNRSRILQEGLCHLLSVGGAPLPIEADFIDEAGTGIGPTNEFYTLLAQEVRRAPNWWLRPSHSATAPSTGSRRVSQVVPVSAPAEGSRADNSTDSGHGAGVWVGGAFMAPRRASVAAAPSAVEVPDTLFPHPIFAMQNLLPYEALGRLLGRCLREGRHINLPLHPVFIETILNSNHSSSEPAPWNLALASMSGGRRSLAVQGTPLSALMHRVDPALESSLRQVEQLAAQSDAAHDLVEELALDYCLPGTDIALDELLAHPFQAPPSSGPDDGDGPTRHDHHQDDGQRNESTSSESHGRPQSAPHHRFFGDICLAGSEQCPLLGRMFQSTDAAWCGATSRPQVVATTRRPVSCANALDFAAAVRCVYFGFRYQAAVEAVCHGIAALLPPLSMTLFSASECDLLLRGVQGPLWRTADDVLTCVMTDHGYTDASPVVKWLADVIAEQSAEWQRAFLLFVSGRDSVDEGGLHPKLTVVRRDPDLSPSTATPTRPPPPMPAPSEDAFPATDAAAPAVQAGIGVSPRGNPLAASPIRASPIPRSSLASPRSPGGELVGRQALIDASLPTVNTCFHYLKLPEYSSCAVLRQQLKRAVADGLGSFSLS